MIQPRISTKDAASRTSELGRRLLVARRHGLTGEMLPPVGINPQVAVRLMRRTGRQLGFAGDSLEIAERATRAGALDDLPLGDGALDAVLTWIDETMPDRESRVLPEPRKAGTKVDLEEDLSATLKLLGAGRSNGAIAHLLGIGEDSLMARTRRLAKAFGLELRGPDLRRRVVVSGIEAGHVPPGPLAVTGLLIGDATQLRALATSPAGSIRPSQHLLRRMNVEGDTWVDVEKAVARAMALGLRLRR